MFQNAEQNNNIQEVPLQRPFEFHKLTSLGLSLFDVRNWYRVCLHLKKIGEEVVYQSLNTWHLFLAAEQTGQGNGNAGVTIRSCPLCLRRTENEGLELRPAEYDGSPAFVPDNGSLAGQNGCWIFISDIEDFICEPDNGGDHADPPAGPAEVEDANSQSAPFNPDFSGNLLQNPPEERTEPVLSRKETREISAATKSTSNKQKTILTPRLKSVKREATSLVIDKDIPLVFSKPKRPRSGNNN